jgi:DNA-damage-inducible protein D
MIRAGKGATRPTRDVELSLYGCYMVVLSSDSTKPIVSLAKDYFAEQTRRQELTDADTFARLSDDEKRLIYRAQLSLYNRKLAQTAHQAGVITSTDHAEFTNWGYKGLYGGLTENDIHALKQLAPEEEISNWMSSEELADNIFRAAQTDAAMKRENVQGKERANTTHFVVASKVREFIINELGGTPPEELPTPQKSTRQLEQEEQFRLKHKAQPGLFDSPQE